MTFRKLILTATIATAPVLLAGQGQTQSTPSNQGGLDPATIGKPLADSWPTYSGDYTGRRYSTLTQINQTTVKNLTLAWVGRVSGPPGAGAAAAGSVASAADAVAAAAAPRSSSAARARTISAAVAA